jgi:hypothetical protein
MSDYRDDTQETAVASDSTWGGLQSLASHSAAASVALFFSLTTLTVDSAAIADEVIDQPGSIIREVSTASDVVLDKAHATQRITEAARVAERQSHRLRVEHDDAAEASDSVIDSQLSMTTETATVSDQVIAQRAVFTLIAEQARVRDFTGQFASVLVVESASADDQVIHRAKKRDFVESVATLSDETVSSHQAIAPLITETAKASDAASGVLSAAVLVLDTAVATDAVVGDGLVGQAWTASVDGWAMSRYAPITFQGLAVVDGVLYGMAADGIYALDGDEEEITATIKTGKVDLGDGGLVHPIQAFMEHELEGRATMAVTTTQNGTAETYSYELEQGQYAELSSDRFKFGRGLRGRHFAFELTLTAQRAMINDLRVDVTPTKRRV